MPFHSVLPDTRKYPAFGWGAPLPAVENDSDGEGRRTASMSAARLREDLDELLDSANGLLEATLVYEEALAAYIPRLVGAYDGDASRVFTFDCVGDQYLNP